MSVSNASEFVEKIQLLEPFFAEHGFSILTDGSKVILFSKYDEKEKSIVIECSSKWTLIKHRDAELTEKFQGRVITKEWLIGYITKHSNKKLVEQRKIIRHCDEVKKKKEQMMLQSVVRNRKERSKQQTTEEVAKENIRYKGLKENNFKKSDVNHAQIVGSKHDICSACLGDGGVRGGCFKCFGSGWIKVENTINQELSSNRLVDEQRIIDELATEEIRQRIREQYRLRKAEQESTITHLPKEKKVSISNPSSDRIEPNEEKGFWAKFIKWLFN